MWLLWLVWITAKTSADVNSNSSEEVQACGGSFNTTEFVLVSPGHPADHPPGLQCSWSSDTSSACGLTLDLHGLRLPPCPSDRLVVGSVQLCGEVSGVVALPVKATRTNITFRGDRDGGPGFNITVRHTECLSKLENRVASSIDRLENFSCGGEFYGDTIVIESPGYPSTYSPGLDCRYKIIRSSEEVCQVEVTFENSIIEYSSGCEKDRLEIQGDRLCGELNKVKTYGIDNVLEIKFVSDSEGNGKGFKLWLKQIKCSDTPIVVDAPEENDKQDYLVDCVPQGVPVFPPVVEEGYPRSRRPFPPFPLPSEGNKNFSPPRHIPHYNNPWGNPPIQRFPPGTPSRQFPFGYPSTASPINPSNSFAPTKPFIPPGGSRLFPSNQIPPPFNPNVPNSFNTAYTPTNVFQPSFQSSYPQINQCCGRVYTDSHFLIVSPGFPRSQSSDCIYTIQRYSPLTFQLRFQFRYFWVGQDTGVGCSGGALEIDGNRLCGCKTGFTWTSQYYDSESVKVLHLRLDSSNDRLFNGFVIEVYQDDSYTGRAKRRETNPDSEEIVVSNGKVVNITQYTETVVERGPLIPQNNGHQLVQETNGQLVWDLNRQAWVLPTDYFCLRWSFQDWILLAKEALWSQYQCPVYSPARSANTVDTATAVTACRTCNYFCRQNCQCC